METEYYDLHDNDDNDDDDDDNVRPSIERDPEDCVMQSIELDECVRERRLGEKRDVLGNEERALDEAQKQVQMREEGWSGYVKYKESWVRRAGLKREAGEGEGGRVVKRGRGRG